MELVEGKIGSIGSYDVFMKSGKVSFVLIAADTSNVSNANLTVTLDACVLLDIIAKAIPGTLDDAILGIAKSELMKL